MRSSSSTRGRWSFGQPTRKGILWLAMLVSAACSGSIDGAAKPTQRSGGAGATGQGGAAGAAGRGPIPDAGPPASGLEERSHRSPGIRRLGRHELSNTFEDLLSVDVDMSALPEDPVVERLSNNANSTKVGYGDLETYLRIAERAAPLALPRFVAWLGCDLATITNECVTKGLPRFLRMAWRRPASAQEVDELAALYASFVKDATPSIALQDLLSSIVLSPFFLYRTERGTGVDAEGFVTLTQYEIASRMSYLVWQSLPDEALMDAAKAGTLATADGRSTQLARMFAAGKGRVGTEGFVLEWLGAKNVSLDRKHQSVLTGLPPNILTAMRKETSQFISHTLFDLKGTTAELLTATYSYPEAALADVYGLDPKTINGGQLDLPRSQRRGLLTQPLVMAAHTKEIGESPIQLGKFVREHVLCQPVPPPPPNVNATLPDDPNLAALPLRQRFEKHASDGVCVSCHRIFDPPGFALLNYDPIGRYRTGDGAGRPYDTAGTMADIDGTDAPFKTSTDMLEIVGNSAAARDCFATQLFRWNLGHLESGIEEQQLATFLTGFGKANGNVKQGIEALIRDPGFTRVRATKDAAINDKGAP